MKYVLIFLLSFFTLIVWLGQLLGALISYYEGWDSLTPIFQATFFIAIIVVGMAISFKSKGVSSFVLLLIGVITPLCVDFAHDLVGLLLFVIPILISSFLLALNRQSVKWFSAKKIVLFIVLSIVCLVIGAGYYGWGISFEEAGYVYWGYPLSYVQTGPFYAGYMGEDIAGIGSSFIIPNGLWERDGSLMNPTIIWWNLITNLLYFALVIIISAFLVSNYGGGDGYRFPKFCLRTY